MIAPVFRRTGRQNVAAHVCLALAMMCAFTGCDREKGVSQYTVPKNVPEELLPGNDRMLAAMVPRGEVVWFFKVTAPEKSIAVIEDELREFVSKVEFDEKDQPVLTSLPDGWRRGGEKRMRFATIDINTPGKQLDLSISFLPAFGEWDDYVKRNVERWRGQLNLEPTEDKWSGGRPFDVTAATGDSVWVDLVGKPVEKRSGDPPPMPTMSVRPQPRNEGGGENSRVKYKRPEGWRDGKTSSMRLASLMAGPEEAEAIVTVIPAGGDERGNVARWMGQVLAEPPSDEAVDAMLESGESVTVSGRPGKRYVIEGDAPESPNTIDATIVPLDDGFSMFIKMTGPSKTVAQQSDLMRSFLESLSF
ncbi:MAG: hypothetical protein AAFX06_27210 [Planctomycetota bacterium]